MKIAVGSTNPAKQSAVEQAFHVLGIHHSLDGLSVPSGVSDQPMSDQETREGSVNRAIRVLEQGDFDLGVGLEGGVDDTAHGMYLCNWCAIADRGGRIGTGGGVRIRLPDELATQIRLGKELGNIIDVFAAKQDVRKNVGTIGILTRGLISRSDMFKDAVICAYTSRYPAT